MSPTAYGLVELDLEVHGEAAGMEAAFAFYPTIYVNEGGQARLANAGEVRVRLVEVRVVFADIIRAEVNSAPILPTGRTQLGSVTINSRTEYKLEAYHYESKSEQVKRVECFPDGAWNEIPNY